MQTYLKFVVSVLTFLLFAFLLFIACIVYYIIQRKKILSKIKSLPPNHKIDSANLTPLNIVVEGSREFRNLR